MPMAQAFCPAPRNLQRRGGGQRQADEEQHLGADEDGQRPVAAEARGHQGLLQLRHRPAGQDAAAGQQPADAGSPRSATRCGDQGSATWSIPALRCTASRR